MVYECHICGGLCDSGELENGVCHECRAEAVKRQEERSMRLRSEFNRAMRSVYKEQTDGQIVLNLK